jgi:hypothetical protein
MRNKTVHVIEVYKQLNPSAHKDPSFFANSTTIDGISVKGLDVPKIDVSQGSLKALAYYVNRKMKDISGDAHHILYSILFPQEISIWGEFHFFSIDSGLSTEEITDFFTALRDVNNPSPH